MFRKLLALLCLCSSLNAQDLEVLSKLCSDEFAGRGYVDGGDSIAASYLASEFKKHSLRSFGDSYFQQFKMDVNTFPTDLEIKLDGNKLQTGVDFIPDPSCKPVSGRFKIFYLDHTILHSKKKLKGLNKIDFSDKVVVLDTKGFDPEKYKGSRKPDELLGLVKGGAFKNPSTVLVQDKLTFGVAGFQTAPLFHALRGKISADNREIEIKAAPVLKSGYTCRNVVGFVEGTKYPDSILVVSAHYDHLGKIGPDVIFRGANDNASGILMLLDLAERISQNPLPCTVVFIAFAAEEAGLKGSDHFVSEPLFPLKKIGFLVNLDLNGTGGSGAMVVNGTIHQKEFSLLDELSTSKKYIALKSRGKAANSDHYYFSEAGVPAFFIYTMGGSTAYHDIYDVPENLTFEGFKGLSNLVYDYFSTYGR